MRTLIFLIFFINSAYSQSSGTINYSLKINNSYSKYPINYLILFKNNKSLEIPLKSNSSTDRILESSTEKEIERVKVIKGLKTPFLYKDFYKHELFNSELIYTNKYLVMDTLNNFKWNITKEHKKVLEYDCIKATTNFRGREYEAWFAEAIPVSNGPWKFCGLPGLILEVYDKERIYNFELTGINLKENIDYNDIKIPIVYEGENPMKYNEFVKIFKDKEIELEAKSRIINVTENSSSTIKTTLPKRMEKY